MLEPANTIIKICGGVQAVADMTGRDPSRVHRWTYPKEKGGTGGTIPANLQMTLMQKAIARGIPLSPSDFFATHPPKEATQ